MLIVGFLPFLLHAQVTVNAQLPAGGLVQKDQLWNLMVINNSGTIIDVVITMSLQDALTGQPVMSANTGMVILNKGLKIITAKDLQPIVYNYDVPEYSNNFLPIGSYTACYQIYTAGEAEHIVSSDCIGVNIDPLSPPILNAPEDKANLQTPYPQFSWMPPAPFDMFSDLSYDILVTEVLPGQAPTEAIQYNTPIYARDNILQTVDNYPSSYLELDTAKTYAWQVIARNGVNYAAKTDVWTFRIHKDPIPADVVTNTPFMQLATSNVKNGIAPNGVLKIVYYNKSVSKTIKVSILDLSATGTKAAPVEFNVAGIKGENYIQYDLNKIMNTKNGGVYLAQIIDDQNEKWFIHFVVKNYKK